MGEIGPTVHELRFFCSSCVFGPFSQTWPENKTKNVTTAETEEVEGGPVDGQRGRARLVQERSVPQGRDSRILSNQMSEFVIINVGKTKKIHRLKAILVLSLPKTKKLKVTPTVFSAHR